MSIPLSLRVKPNNYEAKHIVKFNGDEIYMYICIYVYTHIQTNKHTHTHTHTLMAPLVPAIIPCTMITSPGHLVTSPFVTPPPAALPHLPSAPLSQP